MKHPVDNPYRITGRFGQTGGAYGSTPHTGVDIVSDNLRLYAPHSGSVYSGSDSRNGKYLVIDNGSYRSTLSHMASKAVTGGRVQEGQYVGQMGNTGYVTGVHLHWTLRANGVRVDPEDYLPKQEKKDMATYGTTAKRLSKAVFGRTMSKAEFNQHHAGKTWKNLINEWFTSPEGTRRRRILADQRKTIAQHSEVVKALRSERDALSGRPTVKEYEQSLNRIDELVATQEGLQNKLNKLQAKLDAPKEEADVTFNTALQVIANKLKEIFNV